LLRHDDGVAPDVATRGSHTRMQFMAHFFFYFNVRADASPVQTVPYIYLDTLTEPGIYYIFEKSESDPLKEQWGVLNGQFQAPQNIQPSLVKS
jgi:hypothetical protein